MVFEDISVEMISDEGFDIEQSEIAAKKILENLVNDDSDDYRLRLNFDENVWILPNNKGGTIKFDFNNLDSFLKFNNLFNKDEAIRRIKCWISSQLRSYSNSHVKLLYRHLLIAIEKTQFFQANSVVDFVEFLRTTSEYKNYYKLSLINVTLNFLDYNLLYDLYETYDKEFYSLSNSIKPEKLRRTLPPVKDIITFSMWLDHFYKIESIKEIPSPLFIRFYPVVIWWKLTSIIPLRPSEFCAIERNALKKIKNSYFLKLPRKKNKKNVQVIDEINISEELGNLINNYILLTDKYGKTKTLISYRSINSTYTEAYKKNTAYTKFDFDVFNYSDLQYLIKLFHENVLEKIFNVSVIPHKQELYNTNEVSYDINKRISPGDTRHLAIMSLINQKFHPIEVARLAGHSTLSSYFHYSNHQAYWVDLEVQKLMHNFHKERNKRNNGDIERSQSLWSEITTRALFKPPTSNFREKKTLGYCTDNLKRCFTGCLFCKHWRISNEEFNENKHIIQEKISQKKAEATGLLTDILNMMQAFDVDEFAAINPDIKNALDEKLMMLDAAM